MRIDELQRRLGSLVGLDTRRRDGLLVSRYHGRMVARQISATQLVVRCSFELRDLWLRQFPDTFSVPTRLARHMSVVVDLGGDDGAIEEAVLAAYRLQSGLDEGR